MTAAFDPCGFFVVRAPLLSAELFARWAEAGDMDELRAFLRSQVERPEVREALAVASPSLQSGLGTWIREPESDAGQKVERALVRYLSRMATRPTPFGLFAGCGVGTIGAKTRIRVGAIAEHGRHTRIDNDYLDKLAHALVRDPRLRHRVRYRANSSLYELGGKIRYVEPRRTEKGRTYNLVALEANELVTAAVQRSRGGAAVEEIAKAITACDPEVTEQEALEFVDALIDNDIVVSELEPAVTGQEPVHDMIATLDEAGTAAPVAGALRRVQRTLEELDGQRPFCPQPDRYAVVEQELSALCKTADTRRLLQVDMQLQLPEATLDAGLVAELVEAAEVVAAYCPEVEEQQMQLFCRRFEERYERAEVPLLEVLDEDCGIGFGKLRAEGEDPEPLLSDVHVPLPRRPRLGRTWGPFEEMLLHKVEALAPGQHEIQLTAADLERLPRREEGLPDACALNVTIAAADADAVAGGEYRALLHLADGPSAANWLGRFCHADPQLRGRVEQALREEEARRPDAVFAEIVHLPEGRVGNVLLRPVLRDHEIPFLGRSGAAPEQLLTPDDLAVTVWDGRVVLKSRRLGKEVIPRLCSAHAFPNPTNIGVYRFLGALQTAGRSVRTSWRWGALDAAATFLPRVTYGRVVLSLARWALKPQHLRPLDAPTAQTRWDAMQALRQRLHLPRMVCVADGDNLLAVDLDNRLSVESAVQLLRKRPGTTLVEMFPEPAQAWVESPQGPLTHELVIPVLRRPAQAPAEELRPWLHRCSAPEVKRLFVPGSEWLYLKLYGSPRSVDHALLGLQPLLRELGRPWFFLRMGDEMGWHLRVRIHGPPQQLWGDALPRIQALVDPMIADRLLWKMQIDSYRREVEHFGGPAAIAIAEQILAHDSVAVAGIVQRYGEDAAELAEARWQLALRGVDGIWAALGLDLAARHDVAAHCRAGFAREFGLGPGLEKELSLRFRGVRSRVEAMLDPAAAPWPDGESILAERDAAVAPLFAELAALDRAGELNRPLTAMAHRFSHLHVNRILRSKLREQELVLLDFLSRHYRSAIARLKIRR